MSAQRRNGAQPGYHRIVAKFGTNLLTAGSDRLDTGVMSSLVEQAVRLMDEGREVLIVTSGAIAAGLYDADPRTHKHATLIPRVERITKEIESIAGGGAEDSRGTGGMVTKLQAAKLATGGGSDVFIAGGHERDVLHRIASGEHVGTMLPARSSRMESRKRWMLAGLATKGCIFVDPGAERAVLEQRKSLLPAGVRAVQG